MKNYMSFKSWKRGAIGMVVAIGAGSAHNRLGDKYPRKILNRECGSCPGAFQESSGPKENLWSDSEHPRIPGSTWR